MSLPTDKDARTRASARDPTGNHQARAAWPRPRRWPGQQANKVARAVQASIQILSRPCHSDVAAGFVQRAHFTKKVEQVVLPILALPAHLDSVRRDRDAPRHPVVQLVDVEEAFGVDPDHDVVPLGDDAAEAQTLPAQLDAERVGEVLELGRPRPVSVLQRTQHRVQLFLVLGARELPVGAQPELLVADVRARDEMVEREITVSSEPVRSLPTALCSICRYISNPTAAIAPCCSVPRTLPAPRISRSRRAILNPWPSSCSPEMTSSRLSAFSVSERRGS